jgi:hypothetical protein
VLDRHYYSRRERGDVRVSERKREGEPKSINRTINEKLDLGFDGFGSRKSNGRTLMNYRSAEGKNVNSLIR